MALSPSSGGLWGQTLLKEKRLFFYLFYTLMNFTQKILHYLDKLSVEHILPQTPADGSRWKQDFSDTYRDQWTDRLGNLVLISTKKNSSQGRLDYIDKKTKYFIKNINTCPNSLRVLQNVQWTPAELEANHAEVLTKIKEYYGIQS